MSLSSSSLLASSSTGTSGASDGSEGEWWTEEDGTAHKINRFEFFLNGSHLGTVIFDGAEIDVSHRWRSFAYFCHRCGDVWGRVLQVEKYSFGERVCDYEVFVVACEQHYDQWNLAGSLLYVRTDALIPYLPRALLLREFELHYRQLMKELK